MKTAGRLPIGKGLNSPTGRVRIVSAGKVRSTATQRRVVLAQVSSNAASIASLRYGVSMKISVSASFRDRFSSSRMRFFRSAGSRGR
jgi:hypothetical protein